MRIIARRLFVWIALFLAAAPAASQNAAGHLTGRVVDAATGRPVTGASVTVVGTAIGALSGQDGAFRLIGLPVGTRAVQARMIGFETATVDGVEVRASAASTVEIALSPAALAMEGITVSAAAERGSVSRALDEQRTAVNVTSGITREEIARGPDDSAAEAVQRVSGVTVEGGRYVSVRGLGERYTTTQLDGARLPSPDPDRRRVPLDLFPAGTLEAITVSKTFTPDQSGDFTGAQVNLRTRTFDADPFRAYSVSLGFNDAVTFADLLLPPSHALDRLGLGALHRSIPAPLASSAGPLTDEQQAAALAGFRNAWTGDPAAARPNLSLSYSAGSALSIGGREINYLGSLSYQTRTEARLDERRATPVLRGTEAAPLNEYRADTGRRGVLLGGILNLGAELGDGSRIRLNHSYDRTAENEALKLRGYDEELATDLDVTRLQYLEQSVLSSQLGGEHDLGDRHRLEWSGTFSRVTRAEPDRSELVYARETDLATGRDVWAFFGGGAAPSSRSFSDLSEHAATAQLDYTLRLGDPIRPTKLSFGALVRSTERDSETRSFDFDNARLSLEERALPADELFGGRFFDPATLGIRLRPNSFGGSYAAAELLGAGYAMVERPLGDRLSLVGGARLERARIEVDAEDVVGNRSPAELDDLDLLPALALNLQLGDAQKLRLSAARTLSRPEYRELADVTYREHVGSFLVFGYPELKRALIDNFDARWELYPTGDEVISVGLFAKRFRDPIERVVIPATGAPVLSFRNADAAVNYGLELEMRRRLGMIHPALDALSLTANATLVRSEVDFASTAAAAAATSQTRPLLGQAPYVVNLGLTWRAMNDATATVLFHTVGERLTEVGLGGIPDAYEQPRSTLDLSLEHPVFAGARLRLEAENLLDSETEILQGGVTRLHYRTGRGLSIGLSVQP